MRWWLDQTKRWMMGLSVHVVAGRGRTGVDFTWTAGLRVRG
jgi:hypothetical protein